MMAERTADLREHSPPIRKGSGALWERIAPELLEAFVRRGGGALHRLLAEAPVASRVGFGFRARFLLLDRRGERIKVGLDLLRAELLAVRNIKSSTAVSLNELKFTKLFAGWRGRAANEKFPTICQCSILIPDYDLTLSVSCIQRRQSGLPHRVGVLPKGTDYSGAFPRSVVDPRFPVFRFLMTIVR